MTTTAFTPQQKLTLIKHLAGGKPAPVVATIMHTTPEAVIDLARNHGYPDTEKLAWAADIMAKNLDADAAAALPASNPAAVTRPTAVRPAPIPTSEPAAPVTQQQATKPDEIRVLLNTAKAHPSKRIQSAADRVFDQLSKLQALIKEDHEKNAEKRKAEAEKAAARAEVDRLEAQLAAAKAKLRGKPAPTPADTEPTVPEAKKSTAPKGDYPCRNDGCSVHYDTPQGRSMHERMHCEHRAEAAAS